MKGIPDSEKETKEDIVRKKFGTLQPSLGSRCSECGETFASHSGLFRCPYEERKFGQYHNYASRPEPKFKVGETTLRTDDSRKFIVRESRYLDVTREWIYDSVDGKTLLERFLKPAPKEEWVDVTRECKRELTTRIGGFYGVALLHGGDARLLLDGKNAVLPWCVDGGNCRQDPNYRVEFRYDGNAFRILHLQEEENGKLREEIATLRG
uniref:Uncharacterized protein n=1 Tax=viral metagenome TaxID=1070528 RepID=A0A6M3Y7V6_9ZZZZ